MLICRSSPPLLPTPSSRNHAPMLCMILNIQHQFDILDVRLKGLRNQLSQSVTRGGRQRSPWQQRSAGPTERVCLYLYLSVSLCLSLYLSACLSGGRSGGRRDGCSLFTLTRYKAANIENEYSGTELAVQRCCATVPLSGENPVIIYTYFGYNCYSFF